MKVDKEALIKKIQKQEAILNTFATDLIKDPLKAINFSSKDILIAAHKLDVFNTVLNYMENHPSSDLMLYINTLMKIYSQSISANLENNQSMALKINAVQELLGE